MDVRCIQNSLWPKILISNTQNKDHFYIKNAKIGLKFCSNIFQGVNLCKSESDLCL